MKETPFPTILAALKNPDQPFPERYVDRFSDLSSEQLSDLMKVWPQVPPLRRRTLLKKLNEHFAEDTLLSFEAIAIKLIDDEDEQVRALALQLLDETTDIHLLPRLIKLLSSDPEPVCRARAATALGQFIRMGELEEIHADQHKAVEGALLSAVAEPDGHIARAALESLGYSNRPEVIDLITEAFQRHDPHWQVAALLAAGRSADARWQEQVLAALLSPDSLVRLAAVQAVGDLELKPARGVLLGMLDDEDDEDVFQAIIWSLSQIGGEDVRTYLETLLDETDDDNLIEFIEDALANLSFTEDLEAFDLLAFDADNEPDEEHED